MNLIEESFINKQEKKKKTLGIIVVVAIIIVIIMIISIISYLMYLKGQVLQLSMDGVVNEKLKQLLVFEEDGTIYAPIKEIASFFGYESYNGEYSEKSEERSKCYVQNENEVANFELGQNKIYKLDLTNGSTSYECIYTKKPVKAIDGKLYATTEAIEKAFNISFEYNEETNRIIILTMQYLNKYYAGAILDYGYVELSNELVNQKAVLNDKLIVKKDRTNSKYGVIEVNGNVILEPKYDKITYIQNTGDFLVQTDGKVGILSANRETKVPIMYDSLELMDNDSGLYVAKQDNKYGVIDNKGGIKIYIENDEIGYNISNFVQNNIKNRYILASNLIPVKKDGHWALYDKNGEQLTDYKYDSLGYLASSNKDAINLLVIPNYDVLVACIDRKYTLVNSMGTELFPTVADDIYMLISSGVKYYYITVNDQRMDAIEYLNRNGITAKNNTTSNNSQNNNEQQNYEEQNNNNDEQQNYEEQNNNNDEQQNYEEQNNNNDEQQNYEEQNNNNDEQQNYE